MAPVMEDFQKLNSTLTIVNSNLSRTKEGLLEFEKSIDLSLSLLDSWTTMLSSSSKEATEKKIVKKPVKTATPAMSKDFLGKAAPIGYVAGIGRGASGFTTRSDIGPARDFIVQQDPMALKEEDDDDRYNENDEGLLTGGPYEQDDEEADRIYDSVDRKMDERRKARRELKEIEDLKKQKRPKMQQFEDVKRELASLSESDWANIPEGGDYRAKRMKKVGKDRFTPVPDSVIASGMAAAEYSSKEQSGSSTFLSGMTTPITDLTVVSSAKEKVLSIKLDNLSNSSGTSTCVDPQGYLTGLSSMIVRTDSEIGDIKKGRLLLESLIKTNPKHAPGWISAARLEEIDGKLAKARSLIANGCLECPKSEDVWLEAARLNTKDNSKAILMKGTKMNPESVKLWLAAADLEAEVKEKKKILRKAIESIPNSVRLWKSAIELEEDEEDAKLMLSKAVECIPTSVELWLALARLEDHSTARSVLNKARQACPTSFEIWIAAANLENTFNNSKMVDTIIQRGIQVLSSKNANLSREKWIEQAIICEQTNNITTCQAIIRAVIGMDVEEEDRKTVWMEEASNCINNGHFNTARAIYAHALSVFPTKKSIWIAAAQLEKKFGTKESMDEILSLAVTKCPNAQIIWLIWAKEKWVTWNNVAGARDILKNAFISIPGNEQIWLAAAKLEAENCEYDRAKLILEEARTKAGTEKIWMKSALLEWQLGNLDSTLQLLNSAIEQFPDFDKLWMMKGQVLLKKQLVDEARSHFAAAVKKCSKNHVLWILAAELEVSDQKIIKARSIMDKARVSIPKCPELWHFAVQIEIKAGNLQVARAQISKGELRNLILALQECPSSGILWSLAIFMEPKPARKSKSVDALKKCESDPFVFVATARLFWYEKSLEKARSWFERAISCDPDNGDSFAWFYLFESSQESSSLTSLLESYEKADPKHGLVFPTVSKDVNNWKKSKLEILKLVAAKLEQQ